MDLSGGEGAHLKLATLLCRRRRGKSKKSAPSIENSQVHNLFIIMVEHIFIGKQYTLLIVNPDGQRSGSNWMPFLVGLSINKEGNDVSADGSLPRGSVVTPYVYPIPPTTENEAQPGYVYFLLYEQNYTLNAVDTHAFSHPSSCSEDLAAYFLKLIIPGPTPIFIVNHQRH